MRRWMLLGAPVMLLSALGRHAGGAAAGMLLWIGLGLKVLPIPHYPYPRKRKEGPERLFLSFSALLFCLGLFSLADKAWEAGSFLSRILWFWGALCFSASASGKILTFALPRKFCLFFGLLLLMPGLFFIFYRR